MLGIKHENYVVRMDKKRLKEHVLAHHTGLDLTSFEGVPFNPGVAKKVDALIGEYIRSDASSVAHFFEKEHHSQPIHLRERLFFEGYG